MSVTQISTDLSSGARTSVSVCTGYLSAISASTLNAVVTVRSNSDVLADAAASDARRSAGAQLSVLDGVPFTMKTVLQTAGVRTTNGTSAIDDIPISDGDMAAKAKAAGMILLGKTNVGSDPMRCKSVLFGETKNPLTTSTIYATGGSSGGESAAIASGQSPLGFGVDAAGSIRVPASFCGICGLKPTTGYLSSYGDRSFRMPSRPPFCGETYTTGLLANSLDDFALTLPFFAGPTANAPDAPPLAPSTSPTLRKLVKVDHIGSAWTLSPFVQSKLDAVTAAMATAGITISYPSSPQIPWYDETVFNNINYGLVTEPANEGASWPLNETEWLTSSLNYTAVAGTMVQARAHARKLSKLLSDLIGDADAIITATTALSPPLYGTTTGPAAMGYMAFTVLFNHTRNPCITIPAGIDPATGVGFGIQIVGRHWCDMDLIDIAKQVQAYI